MGKIAKILLDDNEWHLIKQLVEILKQFDTITSTLSDDDNNDFDNEIIEPINNEELFGRKQ
nr:5625_t:CDS:2 [Entrophospora candida]